MRILEKLHPRDQGWLAEVTGIPPSTISDAISNGIKKVSDAVKIAAALDVPLGWLLEGQVGANVGALIDVDDADWYPMLEYDLRNLTDDSLGMPVSRTPMRRDLLNRTFGMVRGLWMARLPNDLPRFDLREGDLAIMRSVPVGEAQDSAVYIVRSHGNLTVMWLDTLDDASRSLDLNDRRLSYRHLVRSVDDREDNSEKPILVARVLGVPLKRL